MREIKFRAWEFHKQEMNYKLNTILFEMTKRSQYSINVDKGYGNRTLNVCGFYLDDDENEIKKDNKDAELMQYTGLKDKNGREIYEGDVVKGHYYAYGKTRRFIGEVKFIGVAFKVVGVKQYRGMHQELDRLYETIGNIYENPELLEVK